MIHSISLSPSGQTFQAEHGETLLRAGLRQNVGLPYGCRNGACGMCKARIVSGDVDLGFPEADALPEAERAAGYALLCCATARNDLTIECREVEGASLFPVKTMPARVQNMDRLAPDVMRLRLRLPANERLQYRAGQYIDVLLKDGQRRSFSMANAPHDDALLELHLRHVPGGVFTDHVFGAMKERDILRINGPHGTFFLREDSDRPVILLAGGTGFAPIKAIVEHAIHAGLKRPMHLYWGVRSRIDLYQHELAEHWAREHSWLRYTPVLSEPKAEDRWTGHCGFVHRAVLDDRADLAAAQVYACGAPALIDAARQSFCNERGLPADQFLADAFTFGAANKQGIPT
jgi:CDP-4-dehydro-6-deoxyglucose reductase, E3